jgi:hypothetical protein
LEEACNVLGTHFQTHVIGGSGRSRNKGS